MTRKDYVLPEIRADPGRKSRSFSLRGSPVLRSEGYGETAGFLYAGASRGAALPPAADTADFGAVLHSVKTRRERKHENEIKEDLSGPAVGVHGDDHDAVRCLCGGGRCGSDR